MACWLSTQDVHGASSSLHSSFLSTQTRVKLNSTQRLIFANRNFRSPSAFRLRVHSNYDGDKIEKSNATGIQLYREIERVLTETVKQSQDGWSGSDRWTEVEGSWVL